MIMDMGHASAIARVFAASQHKAAGVHFAGTGAAAHAAEAAFTAIARHSAARAAGAATGASAIDRSRTQSAAGRRSGATARPAAGGLSSRALTMAVAHHSSATGMACTFRRSAFDMRLIELRSPSMPLPRRIPDIA